MTIPFGSERLAEVAFLCYKRNLSQNDISDLLGVSRSMVSRMLSAAREAGIVRFEINYPFARNPKLESRLLSHFAHNRLRGVVVVDVPDGATSFDRFDKTLVTVGQAAATVLETRLREGMTVGLSWGTTVQTVVEFVKIPIRLDGTVVQLSGEVTMDGVESAYDLVRNLATKLGANYQYLSVPAIAPTVEIASLLADTTHIGESLAQAAESDIAILGVGAIDHGRTKNFLEVARATPGELRELESAGIVGQICSRLFDEDGNEPEILLNQRLLSVSLAQIRKIPEVLIVATGKEKTRAAIAAIRGDLSITFVCDSELAESMLARLEEGK